MKCPECQKKMKCVDIRELYKVRARRYVCECSQTYYTEEKIVDADKIKPILYWGWKVKEKKNEN